MSDSPITDWALEQIKTHGAEPYLGAGLGVVGVAFAAGWGLSFLKNRLELKKLREEARKASAENVERLNEMRGIQKSKCQTLDMTQANLRDALLPENAAACTTNKLRMCRDEMCSAYEEYLEAVNSYLELIAHLASKKEMGIRATVEVIPDLNSMCRFLELANMRELLERIPEAQRFQLDPARRDGLLIRVKALIPLRCIRQRWKVRKIRKRTDTHVRN